MTPHPHLRRVSHARGTFLRRSTAVLAVALVLGGGPLVVEAIGDESAASSLQSRGPATIAPPGDDEATASLAPEPLPELVDGADLLTPPAELRYATALQPAERTALDDPGFQAGTVPAPAPAPALPPGPSAEAWAALRECESGGNYSITNPSGKYRGAYQFDRPTWNSVAGRHNPVLVGVDPAAASPADQDAMAYALYLERGPQPWPHCGRHLR